MAGDNFFFSVFFCYKKCLKDHPNKLTKYGINGASISPVYQMFIVQKVQTQTTLTYTKFGK